MYTILWWEHRLSTAIIQSLSTEVFSLFLTFSATLPLVSVVLWSGILFAIDCSSFCLHLFRQRDFLRYISLNKICFHLSKLVWKVLHILVLLLPAALCRIGILVLTRVLYHAISPHEVQCRNQTSHTTPLPGNDIDGSSIQWKHTVSLSITTGIQEAINTVSYKRPI